MPNNALNKLLELPGFLKRNLIFHAEGINFGIAWIDRLVRYFESDGSVAAVNYPVTLYLEGKPYTGELEVRRDGSHAVRLVH